MHLTDFPDRLSPMLVKELRQGLRTRSFVAVFMSLQAILAVVLLAAGAAATAAVMLPSTPKPAVQAAAAATEPVAEPSGYQLTEHVKQYYASARV